MIKIYAPLTHPSKKGWTIDISEKELIKQLGKQGLKCYIHNMTATEASVLNDNLTLNHIYSKKDLRILKKMAGVGYLLDIIKRANEL
jgi:hypothetical protein